MARLPGAAMLLPTRDSKEALMEQPLAQLIDLTGRTAIVTGGAMGIGRGIAERLHEAGADVVVADIDLEAAEETASTLDERRSGSALAVRADVADAGSVAAMVAETVERFGRIDVLVNNAGIFPFVPLARMSEEDFMRVIDVNLRGVFLCTKAAADRMIEQGWGGRIVNVTSIDALHPSAVGLAHYDASKHGAWGFTKNVALELAEHGIFVNALAPGGVRTPGVEALRAPPEVPAGAGDAGAGGEVVDTTTQRIPMKRLADPDEIGRVAVFLASDLSSYMTGSQVVVDGGLLLS
jgi:2-dehydro-3-deoxy-D-gluconate 5-dehydrogenase